MTTQRKENYVEIPSTYLDKKIKYFSGQGIQILLFITTSMEKNSNQIWTSGISLAGCIPEVYNFKELISWCIDKFDKNKRIIQLQGESPISLAPSVFKRMLRLPESMMNFKGTEA
jgi:hypothetical protein